MKTYFAPSKDFVFHNAVVSLRRAGHRVQRLGNGLNWVSRHKPMTDKELKRLAKSLGLYRTTKELMKGKATWQTRHYIGLKSECTS